MSDWLHNLPVPWMPLVVSGFTYVGAAIIYLTHHSTGGRTRLAIAIIHHEDRGASQEADVRCKGARLLRRGRCQSNL